MSIQTHHMYVATVKCVSESGNAPKYATDGSAGADIAALTAEPIDIPRGCHALIPTGLRFEIPHGYEVQIRSRSGLAAKFGVMVLNSPGTIDSDYRGEVKVILMNMGPATFTVNNGDRIAQMVIAPVTVGRFVLADCLEESARGIGGFGSTGVVSL